MEMAPEPIVTTPDQDRRELNLSPSIQELANVLHLKEVEEFTTGGIKLHDVSPRSLRTLLTEDKKGFNFTDEVDGSPISSKTDFADRDPVISPDQPVADVAGKIQVDIGDNKYLLDVLVKGINQGDQGGMTYGIDISFDQNMDRSTQSKYLDLVVHHLKE